MRDIFKKQMLLTACPFFELDLLPLPLCLSKGTTETLRQHR